jgi:deazaflavin-dependent oxidoreductase (nitroreductase family)
MPQPFMAAWIFGAPAIAFFSSKFLDKTTGQERYRRDTGKKTPYNVAMSDSAQLPVLQKPSAAAALFNRLFGFLVGLGIGPRYMQLLQVRGRKTGRLYSSPVNMLQIRGKSYLVAPRGRTQWVRNSEATGEILLKRGSAQRKYRLRAIPDAEKPEILKLYLDSYKSAVQRFFPVRAGSPPSAFRDIASSYPVFELVPS